MEVRIGIQNVAREVALESNQDQSTLEAAVATAVQDGSLLTLTDSKGKKVLVPGTGIAYVEFGAEKSRPVGFAQG